MTATEKYKEIKKAQGLATEIYIKYLFESIRYKNNGASQKAIKSNARRKELTLDLLQLLKRLENKYILQAVRENRKSKGRKFYYNRR